MRTRNGIYYDLAMSPYQVTLQDLNYYFSSKLHMRKFLKQFPQHRVKINESLSNRFGVTVNLHVLPDLVLYRKIETRGFYVTTSEGDKISWLHNIILDGDKVTVKSLPERCETSMRR